MYIFFKFEHPFINIQYSLNVNSNINILFHNSYHQLIFQFIKIEKLKTTLKNISYVKSYKLYKFNYLTFDDLFYRYVTNKHHFLPCRSSNKLHTNKFRNDIVTSLVKISAVIFKNLQSYRKRAFFKLNDTVNLIISNAKKYYTNISFAG